MLLQHNSYSLNIHSMKSLNQNLFFCLVDILKAAVLKDFGLELCYGLKNYLILPKSFVYMGYQFSSDSLRPHEPQHARPPCPSPTPRGHPNPCPSSQWCHSTTSSSVVPFFSCPQSFPASGSFQMSQLFTWGGQSMEFPLQHQSFQWTPRTDLL